MGYSSWGHKESDMTERLHSFTHSLTGEIWTQTDLIPEPIQVPSTAILPFTN